MGQVRRRCLMGASGVQEARFIHRTLLSTDGSGLLVPLLLVVRVNPLRGPSPPAIGPGMQESRASPCSFVPQTRVKA